MRISVPYAPPLEDIRRAISFVTPVDQQVEPALLEELLGQFARLAAEVIGPSDAVGDVQGASREADGSVSVPGELVKAHRSFVDGGWAAVAHPADVGGGGLGRVVGIAIQEMYASANLGLSLQAVLTQSAVDLLARWGSHDQRRRYLPMLVSGEWSGTMDLTEPDAGSDVGALRTKAERAPGGGWRVTGTKIFITWGEHDVVDNIVHLVLARTVAAPPGTKGISLFVVPKVLPNGTRNAIRCTGLEHKLGIHASPTCSIEFDAAVAEMVGPEHAGMAAMFTMMNAARLAIAVQGLASAERSWNQAMEYARQRRQGRAPGGSPGEPSPIAAHPDVRRMLADLRATTRAMRLLLYSTTALAQAPDTAVEPGDRESAGRMVEVLTPIAKAWATDEGFRLASEALQVHGGVGYVEETGIAQRLRDARIAPIYEGTNGIQAIDLVVRKVVPDGGAALADVVEHVLATMPPAGRAPELDEARATAMAALDTVRTATDWIVGRSAERDDDVLAAATPYLELVGTVLGGVLLVGLAASAVDAEDPAAGELVADALFFAAHRVAPAQGLLHAVRAGADVLPRFA